MPGNEPEDKSTEPDTVRLIPAADQLLAPVSVVAPDSTLLYVNAAAAHAIGQEPRWLIGRRRLTSFSTGTVTRTPICSQRKVSQRISSAVVLVD